MEIEEGHLPFLDIDIYRKPDGSLVCMVYCKPTHTNQYLHHNSHHHPANKNSVLSSLIHRAKAFCDQDSLTQELVFHTTVFKDNGYSPHQIWWAMKPTPWTTKTNDKPIATAILLYAQHMDDSAECWPNITSKASPYHWGKSTATWHPSRMPWD